MKIFVDIKKECQIGKVDAEGRHLFKGDENADILKVYFKHETGEGMDWYLTVNGILPNGRPIAPRVHDGLLGSEIINEEQWYYYQFTLSGENGFNLMKGQITMYIKINYVNNNNQVIKEKTIATVNAVVLESSQYQNNILLLGDSIEDVVFNFKQALESLAARVANDNDQKIVNFLQVLSYVASDLIPEVDDNYEIGSDTQAWAVIIGHVLRALDKLEVKGIAEIEDLKATIAELTTATIQTLNSQSINNSGVIDTQDLSASNVESVEGLIATLTITELLEAKKKIKALEAEIESLNASSATIGKLEGNELNVGVEAYLKVTPEMATYRGSELGTHRELALKYDTSAHNEFAGLMESKHNQMIQEHNNLANNLQAQINLIKEILASDDTSLDSFREIIAVLKDSTADIEALFNQLSTKANTSYVDAQNELDRAYTDTQVSQARSDFADQMQNHEATTQNQINGLEAQFKAFVEQYVGTYPQVIDAMVGDE